MKKPTPKYKCGANTTKNRPCEMDVKLKGMRCRYHDESAKLYKDVKIYSKLKLELDTKNLSVTATAKLNTVLRYASESVKNDAPGFLYVFYYQDDEYDYWKIGRTTRSPKVRLKEWGTTKLVKSYSVKYNKLAETLAFAMLDKYRVYRYVFNDDTTVSGKRFISVSKDTRSLIIDDTIDLILGGKLAKIFPTKTVDSIFKGKKLLLPLGCKKEVEWFSVHIRQILQVIDEIEYALTRWK